MKKINKSRCVNKIVKVGTLYYHVEGVQKALHNQTGRIYRMADAR